VTTKTLIVAATLLLAMPPLLAQNKTAYRCEGPDGRVTYSDDACKGGVALKNDDARTEQQRQAATETVKREEQLGDKLARSRRADEKIAMRNGVGMIANSAAEKAEKADRAEKEANAKARKKTAKKRPATDKKVHTTAAKTKEPHASKRTSKRDNKKTQA
jgi:Domain of unknown function (DUF4124)